MRKLLLLVMTLSFSIQASHAEQQPRTTPSAKPPTDSVVDPRVAKFNRSINVLRQLYNDKKFAEAIALGTEIVEQARTLYGERHLRYTGSLYNLGLMYNGAKRTKEALGYFTKAFTSQHVLRSPADTAYQRVLNSIDAANKQLGRARETGRFYTLALKKLNQQGQINSEAAVYYYTKAGQLMRYLAEYDNAEQLLRHALKTRQRISPPDSSDNVTQTNNLAGLLRARGKFGEAEPLYLEAIRLQIKSKGEWNASTGILLDNIAVMYLNMGSPEKAEPYQKRALAILEKTLGREARSTGITLANLAELYRNLGRLTESEPLFQRAVTVLTKTLPPNHPHLGYVYDNMAGLYRLQNNNAKAYDTYRKAIQLLKAAHGPAHPEVGVALNNIGLVLGDLGRHKEAEANFIEAITLATNAHGPDSVVLSASLGNLADVRIVLGRLKEARQDAARAIRLISKALGDRSQKLILPLTRLGEIEKREGNIQAAFEHFLNAAEIYEQARRRGSTTANSIEDNGAINSLIDAAHTLATKRGTSPQPKVETAAFHFSQLKTLTSAGDALNKLGARLGADNPALRVLARERQDIANVWAKADKTLLAAVSADPKSRNATREAELRAKILLYGKRMAQLDADLAKSYPQFAELSHPSPVSVADIQAKLEPTEVILQYLVMPRHTYAWAITTSSIKFKKIDLPRRTLRDHVHALRCGLDQAEWIGEEKPLRCLNLTGRFAEGDQLPFAVDRAHALYTKLFQPFADTIKGRKLLLVGSDALARLPVHILLTAPIANDNLDTLRNAPWLVRRHAISVLPSSSSLVILRRERTHSGNSQATVDANRQPYLALANPLLLGATGTNRSAFAFNECPPAKRKPAARHVAAVVGTLAGYFRGGKADIARLRLLEPLPETATEVCAVARDLGTSLDSVLLGDGATETAIKTLNSTGNGLEHYSVLHFATHGLVSGELRGLAEPALVLTPPATATPLDDGVLTASEVAELKLNADWVILSACNTAAGSGHGGDALSGLARSFFYAGARSLLVSHWPVRSDAAVALTTRAIRRLTQQSRLGRSAAMQQAMISVIADENIYGSAHPQVWAPFVVVGEGTRRR